MPKMKTKSGAKKRFNILASGKVKSTQAGKRHNMRKLGKRQLRSLRGTCILNKVEGRRVLAYFPYKAKRKGKRYSSDLFLTEEQIKQLLQMSDSPEESAASCQIGS